MVYLNPYSNTHFFSFFGILLQRLLAFCSGQLPFAELASDEVQILVLIGVALSSALVGSFLVLRKMTMLANALSHTILLGIVVVYLLFHELFHLRAFFIASLVTGILTTFLTEFLTKVIRLQEDASIGLVFTSLFATGILLINLFFPNTHIGIELVMGNVDALQKNDLLLVYTTLGMNVLAFTLFFKEFKLTTFDRALSSSLGLSPTLYNYFLMVLTSATAISAFRSVGVFMVLAFFVVPVLIARLFTHTLSTLIYLSMGIGGLSALVGVALSRHIFTIFQVGLSTGGIVVCTLLLFYLIAIPFALKRRVATSALYRAVK